MDVGDEDLPDVRDPGAERSQLASKRVIRLRRVPAAVDQPDPVVRGNGIGVDGAQR